MADRYPCVTCRKDVAKIKNDHYRSHSGGDGEPCPSAATPIPEHVLANGPVNGKQPADVPVEGVDYAQCPQCTRKVKLTQLGYFEPHDQTLRGGDRCPVSGVRAKHARSIDDKLLPGDQPASAEPKVKDSSTPVANRGTGAAYGQTSERVHPATESSFQIDWSKVGDLKFAAATPPVSTATPNATTSGMAPDAEERVASLPDGTMELKGEPWPQPMIEGTPLGPREVHVPGAASSASTENSSPASSTISRQPSAPPPGSTTSSAAGGAPADAGPFHLAPLLDAVILQPFSYIFQPTLYAGAVKVVMGDLAKELATKIKETFYAYSNRKTSDNRSAQTTLGPSEIGTPCDRRLAMALLGVRPVNAGGDGWAAFVGTCTHAGMAEVYTFADAGTGRYAVELPVFLGVPTVPRGTTDLLDRRDGTIIDWKVMGKYSLDKFKKDGPSDTYRTQAHVYGLGAERGGEKVRNVAIVGLPRAGSSLDETHIWAEPYDRKLAQAALARVERIAKDLNGVDAQDSMRAASFFEAGDDCRYCQFHLEGDKEMRRGCPGK